MQFRVLILGLVQDADVRVGIISMRNCDRLCGSFDMEVGWPDLVERVARIHDSLPPEERERLAILADDGRCFSTRPGSDWPTETLPTICLPHLLQNACLGCSTVPHALQNMMPSIECDIVSETSGIGISSFTCRRYVR